MQVLHEVWRKFSVLNLLLMVVRKKGNKESDIEF